MYQKELNGIKFECILFFVVTFIIMAFSTCSTIPSSDSGTNEQTIARTANVSNNTGTNKQTTNASRLTFTGNGGKGIVIAVPAPSISGTGQSDNWMPQLFQDLITGDMARYSAMTVLDRRNEAMTLAEQQLSASGNYSDDDYIAMGRLTNAKYIVAGNILGVSGRYSVTFRINNTETNEIKASFNKQYIKADIESGLAAKEAVLELLTGMGVELTAEGEKQLLTIQERSVRAQVRLAQGMASERNDNLVESLVYFNEALNADQGMREASQRIQNFAQGSPGASIRERANWATAQKEKWEKIFDDLVDYVNKNGRIVVYDFSTISDQFDAGSKRVTLTITPGIKLIPDSMVFTVWKNVLDQWYRIKDLEENKSWVNSVSLKRKGSRSGESVQVLIMNFKADIELYDEDGIRIADNRANLFSNPSIHNYISYKRDLQILPQNRYFSSTQFNKTNFSVPLDKITDNLSVKVVRIRYDGMYIYPTRIMSQSEYDEWVKK